MKRTVLVAVALAAMFGAALWNLVERADASCAAARTQKQRRACEDRVAAPREADAAPARSAVDRDQRPARAPT